MTWSQTVVLTWAQFALASTVILSLSRLALRRTAQPAERIRLIQLSLAAAIAVPFIVALAPWPAWRLGWFPTSTTQSRSSFARVESASSPNTAELDGEHAIVRTTADLRHSASLDRLTEEAFATKATPSSDLKSFASSPAVAAPTPQDPWSKFPDPWLLLAVALLTTHVGAAVYFVCEWLIGRSGLRSLCQRAIPGKSLLNEVWSQVTVRRGEQVELLISADVDAPLTFGVRRPVVVVPRSIAAAGGGNLRFCLAHEWSHIERGDVLAWRLVSTLQYLLWWQPLFWSLRQELRLNQDLIADDRSAPDTASSLDYAELLVNLARSRLKAPCSSAVLTILDHPSQLTRRVTMLLQRKKSLHFRCNPRFTLAATLTLGLAAALFAGVRLESVDADDSAKSTGAAATPEAPAKEQPSESLEHKTPEADASTELKYTGVILDKETGKPIPQAAVTVRRSALSAQENRVIEETKHQTDAEGRYSFVVPPEQLAVGSLYIELDVEHADYSSKKGFGYAMSMIRKNEGLGERPFFEKVELRASEPIHGRVTTPDGKPVAGVMVLGYSKANATDFRDYGSFTETKTDDDGKFRLNLIKNGVGIYWVIPDDYAVTSRLVGKERSEIADIRLQPGIRVSGQLLDVEGQPVAGIPVTLTYRGGGAEVESGLPVMTSVRRGFVTDEEGRFSMRPLPPGDYLATVDEHLSDPTNRDRKVHSIPGVFTPTKVTLKEGRAAQELRFQAVPHVVFNAQYYNAKGEKTRGHEAFVNGQIDGEFWFGQARPDADGTIALKVPHGLQNVRVSLMTNEHGALRYRLGPGQELKNQGNEISLGTLNEDVEAFEIIRYTAPMVLISAVDEAGKPIPDFRVSATYPWGQQQYVVEGEERSDMSFEHQTDGRFRTSQMLPDEDVTFTVKAKGYETATEKVNLAEGEKKELVVTLKKAIKTAPEKAN